MQQKSYLFFCYSSKDLAVVAELVAALEGKGFNCWYAERDLAAGKNFGQRIVQAINGAFGLVYIHSKDALKSNHVLGACPRNLCNTRVACS